MPSLTKPQKKKLLNFLNKNLKSNSSLEELEITFYKKLTEFCEVWGWSWKSHKSTFSDFYVFAGRRNSLVSIKNQNGNLVLEIKDFN